MKDMMYILGIQERMKRRQETINIRNKTDWKFVQVLGHKLQIQ